MNKAYDVYSADNGEYLGYVEAYSAEEAIDAASKEHGVDVYAWPNALNS